MLNKNSGFTYRKGFYRQCKRKAIPFLVFFFSINYSLTAQTSVELSAGSSFQDNFNAQLAIRNQFGQRFNGGLEIQTGLPKYRFVATKVMREGYTFSLSVPVSYLIQDQEKIQLYGVGRLGARFQGIIDPDDNNMRDSVLQSTAVIGEFGLMTTFNLTEEVNLQSGITFPFANETSPLAIMEYTQVKLHLGGSYIKNKTTLFVHSSLGPAFGATGDTYKYIWALDAGIRFNFGERNNDQFKLLQTSF